MPGERVLGLHRLRLGRERLNPRRMSVTPATGTGLALRQRFELRSDETLYWALALTGRTHWKLALRVPFMVL